MANKNTKETDDNVVDNVEEGIANEAEATDIANVINNQPSPLPTAPRLSDLSSYQSRRSTTNTLELNTDDDNSDMPLPMGMAEVISNTVEPPKHKIGKVEQIDDDDNGPEPPTAMLEASLNAAAKSNDMMISSSLESVDDDELNTPPTPFHSSNFERDDEDKIAKKKAKDDMNQKPAAVSNSIANINESLTLPSDRDSIYAPSREDIERGDEIRCITNTNTGRGDTNRRGWDDIGSGSINNAAPNDILAEVSHNNDSMAGANIEVAGDTAEIHIPEAFLVEDGYDDNGEVYIATPTLPWWKQKRTKIFFGVVILLVGALAIALALSLSSSSQSNNPEPISSNSTTVTVFVTPPPTPLTYECFSADDGGRDGILGNAVRAYVLQDCANNKDCLIGQTYGWPMNSWCVGNVKDMSRLFEEMDTFNEDINGWNTSSVTDMNGMFFWAEAFNGTLSNFDTSKVTDMSAIFASASLFNGDISNFDTSSVTTMAWMFTDASSFNRDLSNFNTSKVTEMWYMFNGAFSFNGDVSNFDTSSVTKMYKMFEGASSFNGDVSSFDTSSVTEMWGMFNGASSFNQDLCSWQDDFPYTGSVYDIFTDSNCTYQDTPNEVQKRPFCASDCQSSPVATTSFTLLPATTPPTMAPPTSMSGQSTPSISSSSCFAADDGGKDGVLYKAVRSYVSQDCSNNEDCEIGQTYGWPMNSWCVEKVTDMSWLFEYMDTFNENISNWNTSSVTRMNIMFAHAKAFNQDLSNFDTSSVWDMSIMFRGATSFNGDISNFDTSRVTEMYAMFQDASSFNQYVSSFDISSVNDMTYMFAGATSFDKGLCSWRNNFPYTKADNIFTDSGCTYQDAPNETQKGPFCASDCQSSQESTTSPTLPVAATTTTSDPQQQEECIDTPNYLDMYNGGCDLYALAENEAWCGAYGNDGEVGMTPNENCCVCK